MRVVLQPAFVLHQRPYRNTSLVLDILSRDHGRIGLVARGVRTPRSRLKGLLQSFRPLLLSWSGQGELSTLTAAEEVGSPVSLPPGRLLYGFYLNELLLRLLPRDDPHPSLFLHYGKALEALAVEAGDEPVLRIFEKHLLAQLGYGLRLDTEAVSGAPIVTDAHYRYVLDQGPIGSEQTRTGVGISGRGLLALHHEVFQDDLVLREVKHLTRAVLHVHLRGRPLHTRELWQARYRRRSLIANGALGTVPLVGLDHS